MLNKLETIFDQREEIEWQEPIQQFCALRKKYEEYSPFFVQGWGISLNDAELIKYICRDVETIMISQ